MRNQTITSNLCININDKCKYVYILPNVSAYDSLHPHIFFQKCKVYCSPGGKLHVRD